MEEVNKVKKPMNAFFLYRQEMKSKIYAEFQTQKSIAISQIAATQWRNESEEVKQGYRERANERREKFKAEYPNFIWPSKKTRQNKRNLRIIADYTSSESRVGVKLDGQSAEMDIPKLEIPHWNFSSAEDILKDFFDVKSG